MSCHGEVVCGKMYAVVEKFACDIPALNWLYWLLHFCSLNFYNKCDKKVSFDNRRKIFARNSFSL